MHNSHSGGYAIVQCATRARFRRGGLGRGPRLLHSTRLPRQMLGLLQSFAAHPSSR